LYTDTISMPAAGCYRLQITDGGGDGLQWWPFGSAGITNGYLNVKKLNPTATNIPMNGYQYSGTFNNDFGSAYSQYFYAVVPVNGVDEINDYGMGITAYPNPARSTVVIELNGIATIKGTIRVTDIMGRLVMETACTAAHQQLSIDHLISGIYTVSYTDENGNKLQTRLSVAK
jgi:hypothetical protein